MKTKIRRSQLLVIGCFFGFFLFCLVWGLAQPVQRGGKPVSGPAPGDAARRDGLRRLRKGF